MRKVLTIALREYNAAVRTRAFIISLVLMPLLMGGSALVQWLARDVKDPKPKVLAVVDRTGGSLADLLERKIEDLNEHQGTKYVVEREEPSAEEERGRQRFELSERVRQGEVFAIVEIGREVLASSGAGEDPEEDEGQPRDEGAVRFQSNRLTTDALEGVLAKAVQQAVRQERARRARVAAATLAQIDEPVPVVSKGLTRQSDPGTYEDVSPASRIASFAVPLALMMLMFMVMMMGATPLMQGVVEEKMQRISEVLLGSVRPFTLMMGKLLGMTAVSLTISAVYLGGGLWAAYRFGFGEYIPLRLLAWFFVFQVLAALMYGSLFSAVGAACSDMKETQSLLWPVMLLAVFPMFLLGSVLQEPNSSLAVGASFFPFSTPTIMMMRLAIPPGVPWWQPALGAVLVLGTTLACVWVAGRVFRVGLLMQGKGAQLGDLVRWVLRG